MARRVPSLAFLLRPGWVALWLVCIAFTYLCFTVLAPWQLGKNTRTSRENQQITDSLNTPPVALKTLLPHQDSSAPEAQCLKASGSHSEHGNQVFGFPRSHALHGNALGAMLRVAAGECRSVSATRCVSASGSHAEHGNQVGSSGLGEAASDFIAHC